jgi:AcrR family transcriptional regulator
MVARPAASRREREREDMRHRIIEAARHLFVSEGYESTTIRRIAEAIEYTPGAIYSYFKDKDALLYALHQQGFTELQRRFIAAVSAGSNPAEQLQRAGDAYIAFAHDNPEMYHLMFVAQATSRTVDEADAWPEGRSAHEGLLALVQVAISTGWIRPGDPSVIAFALWAAAHGAVTLEICNRDAALPREGRAEMASAAFRYVLQSMLAEPPPQQPSAAATAAAAESAEGPAAPHRRRWIKES